MGQIIQLIDSKTKENVNYEEILVWYDGTPMDDSKVDNVIYRKKGDKYYVRAFAGIRLSWFGDDLPALNAGILLCSRLGKLLIVDKKVDLSRKSVTINCDISFENGEIENGGIIFENTRILSDSKIFHNVNISGAITGSDLKMAWFGGSIDNSQLQNIVNFCVIGKKNLDLSSLTVVIPDSTIINIDRKVDAVTAKDYFIIRNGKIRTENPNSPVFGTSYDHSQRPQSQYVYFQNVEIISSLTEDQPYLLDGNSFLRIRFSQVTFTSVRLLKSNLYLQSFNFDNVTVQHIVGNFIEVNAHIYDLKFLNSAVEKSPNGTFLYQRNGFLRSVAIISSVIENTYRGIDFYMSDSFSVIGTYFERNENGSIVSDTANPSGNVMNGISIYSNTFRGEDSYNIPNADGKFFHIVLNRIKGGEISGNFFQESENMRSIYFIEKEFSDAIINNNVEIRAESNYTGSRRVPISMNALTGNENLNDADLLSNCYNFPATSNPADFLLGGTGFPVHANQRRGVRSIKYNYNIKEAVEEYELLTDNVAHPPIKYVRRHRLGNHGQWLRLSYFIDENYGSSDSLTSFYKGIQRYSGLRLEVWDGSAWKNALGYSNAPLWGSSAARPSLLSTDIGFQFFDTTLNKPIWWNGSSWVDSNGTAI